MPSEYWAEMMDFWHCHKLHDHGSHNGDEHTAAKGYAAATKVTAESGIGLVDISFLLFAEKDCHGVQVSTLHFRSLSIPSGPPMLFSLHCNCHVQMGKKKETLSRVYCRKQ